MTAPDTAKSRFRDLRQVVAVQLTTDPWTLSAGNHNFEGTESSSDDHFAQLP
jgi:hypothetical protein